MNKLFKCLFLILVVYYGNKFIVQMEQDKLPRVQEPEHKKAIVIGATSGIGRQVAKELAKSGYEVGLVGRRLSLLDSLQKEIKTKTYLKQIDVSNTEEAKKQLEECVSQMGGLDLMVISISGQGDFAFGISTSDMSWQDIRKFVDVDTTGFLMCAYVAIKQFEKQGYGHLVGVSSVAKARGFADFPEYCAAKAFISKYLDGIRNRMMRKRLPIFVTEIVPGWVDVERQKYSDLKGTFWVTTKEEAAVQVMNAIKEKRENAYITKRWRLVSWGMSIIPDWLYRKIF